MVFRGGDGTGGGLKRTLFFRGLLCRLFFASKTLNELQVVA